MSTKNKGTGNRLLQTHDVKEEIRPLTLVFGVLGPSFKMANSASHSVTHRNKIQILLFLEFVAHQRICT